MNNITGFNFHIFAFCVDTVKCCNAQFAKFVIFYHAAAPSSDALYIGGAILVGAVIIVVGIACIVIINYIRKKRMQFV